MKPAVVLAAHTIGLGVTRSLREKGVPIVAVTHDPWDFGHLSRYVTETVVAPQPEAHEAEFVGLLLELGARLGTAALFPASDPSLVVTARHKRRLEQHFAVACADFKTVERCIDKKRTYELARAAGVPAPRTTTPLRLDELEACGQAVGYPCLVKPSQSHRYVDLFGKKLVRVESLDQLRAAYLQAAQAGLAVMVQEFIPGEDSQGANYNSYWCDGEPLVEFTAQKIRGGPPVFGSPRVLVSKPIPEVVDAGRSLLRALRLEGYACTEFKRDPRDGRYKLMEVNARHNLSSRLAVRCGIDFPWLHYRHLLYGERPRAEGFEHGIHWIDLVRDLGFGLEHLGQERLTPAQFLAPYFKPHVFAILDVRDPKPFLKRFRDAARMALGARKGRRTSGKPSPRPRRPLAAR